jgi:hypothetical protein
MIDPNNGFDGSAPVGLFAKEKVESPWPMTLDLESGIAS